MDVNSGKILEFEKQEDLEEAKKYRELVELKGKPKKSCKKCYGLGHLGRDVHTDKYIICMCVKKEKIPDADEVTRLADELVQKVTLTKGPIM